MQLNINFSGTVDIEKKKKKTDNHKHILMFIS